MNTQHFIPVQTLSAHYELELSFFSSLGETGLLRIALIEETHYIHEDEIPELEKMIRLHRELDLSTESIDIVMNLLKKMDTLKEELAYTKSRLRLYE